MTARKRTNTADTEAPPDGALAPRQAVSHPDELDDDVDRILAELGESASSVSVSRESDEKPGRFDFLTRLPAPEFSAEAIARDYGGGYYRIIITDATQGPLNPVYFSVDKRIVGRAFSANRPATTSHDDATFKDKVLDILLMRALQPQQQPTSETSTLDMALRIAELFKGNNGGNTVELLTVMLGAATEMAKNMNPPEGLAGVASTMVPMMEKLLASQQPAPAVRRIPARTEVIAAPVVQPPPTPTAEPVDVSPKVVGAIFPKWLEPFKPFAPMLVNLADGGADPRLYTEVILDLLNSNEDAFKSAVTAMEAGKLLDDVLNAVPAMKEREERKAFASALVENVEAGLREMLKDDGTDEEESA